MKKVDYNDKWIKTFLTNLGFDFNKMDQCKSRGEPISTCNNPEYKLHILSNISIYVFEKMNPGNCKVVIVTPWGRYCYLVDCDTGKYIGKCPS
jgi:hypothetical protein